MTNNHEAGEREADDRENVEGRYTESDDEGPTERAVHGEYTETAENPDPEPENIEGSFTDTDTDPDAHDRDGEKGSYTDADE
jgi:hypothetical protein